MPTKRLSTRDLRALVAKEGLPFGKELISDNLSDDWRLNRYDERVGQPFAVWTHTDDSEPVTLTGFFAGLVEYMENAASDDPEYFRRVAPPRSVESLRASIKRHAARNQQGKILKGLDRVLRIARA
ncbi:MAG: hypothetical protein WC262_12080 [Bacteroidales bacterium]|jgi:hypothetical protein